MIKPEHFENLLLTAKLMFVFVDDYRALRFSACLIFTLFTRIDSLVLQNEELLQLMTLFFILNLSAFGLELTRSDTFIQQLYESHVSMRKVLQETRLLGLIVHFGIDYERAQSLFCLGYTLVLKFFQKILFKSLLLNFC